MADILLINPSTEQMRFRKRGYIFPDTCSGHGHIPQSFLFLSGYLKKNGYAASVLNMELYPSSQEEELVKQYVQDVEYVGFSVMSAQVPHALKLSKYIKKFFPDKTIIWGGVHPTLLPDQTAAHYAVDYVVVGEGEEPLVRILDGSDHSRVVSSEKSFTNVRDDFLDPSEIADPDYEIVDINEYFKFQGVHRNVDILSSRGCPYGCTFCINTITKNKWRCFDADRTISIIKNLYEKYRLQHTLFLDEDFFLREERAYKIVKYLASTGITWDANITVKMALKIDDDFLKLVRDSGVHFLKMGAESGSDRLLKIIKKNVTINEIYRAARRCLDFGITPSLSFMCNLPDEQPDETIMTYDFAKKCRDAGANVIGPQTFRPYPGSLEFEKLCNKGFQLPDSLEKWAKDDLFSSARELSVTDRFINKYKPVIKNYYYNMRESLSHK